MRSIHDCPVPTAISSYNYSSKFACDICGEPNGHTCTLRGYGVSTRDLEQLEYVAKRRDLLGISAWLCNANWSQTGPGFMGFGDESEIAQKTRVKKLLAFARDALDHVEEWSK